MNKTNLESSHMKAQARLAKYKEKHSNDDEDEFKRGFIMSLMKDPQAFQAAMNSAPEAMSRLMKRYGVTNGTSK